MRIFDDFLFAEFFVELFQLDEGWSIKKLRLSSNLWSELPEKFSMEEGIRERIEWRREEYHFLFCIIETIKSFSFDILNSRIILKDFCY